MMTTSQIHNPVAERAVLGGVLTDPPALDQVIEILKGAEDFYAPAHRTIYTAMVGLQTEGKAIDLVTLADRLASAGTLATVGGATGLSTLQDETPSAANVAHHALIVRDKALLRALRLVSSEIAQECNTVEGTWGFLDDAAAKFYQVIDSRIATNVKSMPTLMLNVGHQVEEAYKRKAIVTGLPSGFLDLDKLTAGFQAGDLVILAARPSMGKTAFALSIAQATAIHDSTPIGIQSLEMTADSLALRLVGMDSGVNHWKIRTGQLDDDDLKKIGQSMRRLSAAPIVLDDSPSDTILTLRAKARRFRRQHDIRVLIVDYLQLVHGSQKGVSRVEEVTEISQGLKALAKELQIPVIALSQLNRRVEERADKRPIMSDIRESGSIEQDADLILFLYRDEVYHPDSADKGTAEVIIGKQRNGPTGTVTLNFDPQTTSFQ